MEEEVDYLYGCLWMPMRAHCENVTCVIMAFRKGGNKLGNKTNNINNDIDKNIIKAYKGYEEILNGTRSLSAKIPCLIDVWKEARKYSVKPLKPYKIYLMDWLNRHTLTIILNGDWKKFKINYEDVLVNEVVHCEMIYKGWNASISLRFKKLIEIIRNPWGNDILHKLLNNSEILITQEELEFFAIETGYIISMRLKMLCESRCEDLALNLANTCLQCYKVAEEQNYDVNATEDQKRFILDTYVALLFKFKRLTTITEVLKTLPLQNGLDLVKRFSNKRINISKIWKYSKEITHLSAQVYITAALLKPPEESSEILKELLNIWLDLDVDNEESFQKTIRHILQAADSAVHIYIFIEVIYSKVTMKLFMIELYIRALTTDMNDLERLKNEENYTKFAEITNRLATGFLQLAEVLKDKIKASRECVLTAFSLQPNEEVMKKILELAKLSGYEVLNTELKWKCKLHPPVDYTDEIMWICNECGDYMSEYKIPCDLNTDIALNNALIAIELEISNQLCDDLAVVIAAARNQFLSWKLDWNKLYDLCVLYLNIPEKTKALVKKLNFVEIDYGAYLKIKKEPKEELTGIEKGYEDYFRNSDEETAEDATNCNFFLSSNLEDKLIDVKCNPIQLLPSDYTPMKKQDSVWNPQMLDTEKIYKLKSDAHYFCIGLHSKTNFKISEQNQDDVNQNCLMKVTLEKNKEKCDMSRKQKIRIVPPVINVKHKTARLNSKSSKTTRTKSKNSSAINQKAKMKKKCNTKSVTSNNISDFKRLIRTCSLRCPENSEVICTTHSRTSNYDCVLFKYPLKKVKVVLHRLPDSQTECNSDDEILANILRKSNKLKKHSEIHKLKKTKNSNHQNISENKDDKLNEKRRKKTTDDKKPKTFGNSYENTEQSGFKRVKPKVVIKIKLRKKNNKRACSRKKEKTSKKCHKNKEKLKTVSKKVKEKNLIGADRSSNKENEEYVQVKVEEDFNEINVKNEINEGLEKSEHACAGLPSRSKLKSLNQEQLFSLSVKKGSAAKRELPPNFDDDFQLAPEVEEELKRLYDLDIRSLIDVDPSKCLNAVHLTEDDFYIPEYDEDDRIFLFRDWLEKLCTCDELLNYYKKRKPYELIHASKRIKMEVLYDTSSKEIVESVLYDVPGLNDLEMILPGNTDSFVQVVQVSDPTISTAPTQNSQTSTQVTPHIQRVGQPRTDKPDNINSNASVNSSSVITSIATPTPVKTSVTEANPTIVNILQNQIRANNPGQIIRPVHVTPVLRPAGIITTHPVQRNRINPPVINILSQQIIRPATIVSCPSRVVPISTGSDARTNEIHHQIITNSSEDVTQLAGRLTSTSTLKTIVGTANDQNRIVQFICKSSDGKIIPVTSLASNKIVKMAVSQALSSSADNDVNMTMNLDNSFTKLIQPIKTISESTETSEALPKFQQAFGKSYQGNLEAVQILATANNNENNNSNPIDDLKTDLVEEGKAINKPVVKTTLLPNLQHIQGSVIYSHQGVSQTINLIPPGKGQVIRIATSNPEQVSLVKDSLIHNKMSALLAAALQGRQQQQSNNNATEADSSSEDSLSQSPTIKITPQQRQTLVSNARIVKPVVQVSSNVIRNANNSQSNLSSTTLEQLREFDMVYKQVKERSNTSGGSEVTVQSENNSSSPPQISVTYLNQSQKLTCAPVVVVSNYCTVQSAVSPALSVSSQRSSSPCVTPSPSTNFKGNSKTTKSKSIKTVTTHASKAAPIPKPQQKPQEDEHTAQRIFDILAEYAEQLRNSPDLNNKPAPRRRSNPPTNPSQNTKRKKNSSTKKATVQGSSSNIVTSDLEVEDSRTAGSEDSSCGVVHLTLPEEEHPPTSVTAETIIENSTSPKQLILTEANSRTRNLILTDSAVSEAFKMSNTAVLMPGNYIMPVSMVKGGQQIRVVSGNSKILAAMPSRSGPNMLLFQSFVNQSRKPNISSVKYSTIQPVTNIQTQAQPSVILPSTTQSLTSFTLGQPITVKKSNEGELDNFNGDFLLAISNPRENTHTSENANLCAKTTDCTVVNNCQEHKKQNEQCVDSKIENVTNIVSKEEVESNKNPLPEDNKGIELDKADLKRKERVQTVLVAPGSTNSPMLFQNPPNYSKNSQPTNLPVASKEDFVSTERKGKDGKPICIQSYQNKNKKSQSGVQHLDRELHQLSLQRKQAALERELRLQKSLSEECEDLGVDEPSTSELFPEADLYFDSNHSPSFDQSSHDTRKLHHSQIKPETKSTINLFEDDDNSSSFRADFLFDDPVGYRSTEMELEYDRSHGLTNGQKNSYVKLESGGEESPLSSPVLPESCEDPNVLPINKCKYKYSNRRKGDRLKNVENWSIETSSNPEMKPQIEMEKSCSSPVQTQSEDLCEDIIKTDVKVDKSETQDYVEVFSEEDEEMDGCVGSVSGRGARRSVKKQCSCCNGPQDGSNNSLLRKRPASRPHTPALNKKSFISKKR